MQLAARVARRHRRRIGAIARTSVSPQPRRQLVAIGQRLGEVHPGVEEQHRHGAVDLGDQRQQHRRVGAERRHHREAAGEIARDGAAEQRHAGVLHRGEREIGNRVGRYMRHADG